MSPPKPFPLRLAAIVAANDEAVLARNLLASPMIASGAVPAHVERGAPSAAAAYNRGLAETDAPILLFTHQDVYFPEGWEARLAAAIDEVAARDPDWALIGTWGITAEGEGQGHLWSSGVCGLLGGPMDGPARAQSLDELLIVMRRDAGLVFDEDPPLWHFYGTDIVQIARSAGRSAWIADLPLVHNDRFHGRLGADFTAGYDHMRRKWRARLPLRTPILWIDRLGLSLPLYHLRAWRSLSARQKLTFDSSVDPRVYAQRCGWEAPEGRAEAAGRSDAV